MTDLVQSNRGALRFRRNELGEPARPGFSGELYRALLPLLNSQDIELLDNQRLINQLTGLERRTARSAARTALIMALGSTRT